MGEDRIVELGDRAREGEAAGVYGAGFTARPLAGKGVRSWLRGRGARLVLPRS